MTPYKLLTFETPNGRRSGIVFGEAIYEIALATGRAEYVSIRDILEDWDRAEHVLSALRPRGKGWPLAQAQLFAPLLYPGAIYCAGINYRDRAAEMAQVLGQDPNSDPRAFLGEPWHFQKAPRCVTDPNAKIAASQYCNNLDYEVELAAVIGRRAKNLSVENALNYVAGYTAANDLSARDKFRRVNTPPAAPFHYDWIGQKCFDGSCPIGPAMVPARDIPNPQNLAIKLWVNGALKQDSNTSQMIFSVAEQIAHLSKGMTLYPGDMILTGTPAGVGAARGEFLKPGDVVTIEIEKIGKFANTIA